MTATQSNLKYRHKYTHKCQRCGLEFHPCHRHNRFCSRKCGVIGRSGITRIKRKRYRCDHCGIFYERTPCKQAVSTRHFCSASCKNADSVVRYSGKNNPNYRNNPGDRICEHCGKHYQSYTKERRFCSQECSWAGFKSHVKANQRKGHSGEKELATILRRDGYHVTRSCGSRGLFDLIAINRDRIRLIQVKVTRCRSRGFTKKTISALAKLMVPKASCITREIACKLDHGGWEFRIV